MGLDANRVGRDGRQAGQVRHTASGARQRDRGGDPERRRRVRVHAHGDHAASCIPLLPPTPLWAYDDGSGLAGQTGSFGMAIAARRGTPLDINYTNRLPATYPARIPVDTRLTPFGTRCGS